MYNFMETPKGLVNLPVMQFNITMRLKEKGLEANNLQVSTYHDPEVVDQIVSAVLSFVSQPLDEAEIKMPEDWWQAVKERFAPKWFINRYPIQYIVKRITAKAVYPKIAIPTAQPAVVIEMAPWYKTQFPVAEDMEL